MQGVDSMRCAVIENGIVVNVVEAQEGWEDPGGRTLVPSDAAGMGDSYDGTSFVVAKKDPPPVSEQAEYAALTTQAEQTEYIARKLGLVPPVEA